MKILLRTNGRGFRSLALVLSLSLTLALTGCGSSSKKEQPADGPGTEKKAEPVHNEGKAAESYESAIKAEAASEYLKARDFYLTALTCFPGYKDCESRLKSLEKVVAAQKSLGSATEADKAQLEVEYAQALRDRYELDKAAAELEKALGLNPALGSAHTTLATVLYETGDQKASLDRASKAIDADPTSAEAHYQLAFLHRTAQLEDGSVKPEKAIEHAKLAVKHAAAGDWKAHELLAACYRDAGQSAESVAELKEACKVSRGLPRLMKKLEAWAPGEKVEIPQDKPADAPAKPADAPPADKPADAPAKPADAPPADKPADAPAKPADAPPADAPPADKPGGN